MKSSIADSINSLPPLSQTILDINKVYADEESTIMDMAKAVETDPMIIANLLKAANSPLYGFAKEIQSSAQAVSLFGMNMTRSIALSNAVRNLLNIDMQPYGISSQQFAENSELQASILLRWFKQVDKKKAEKMYLASFLQETGKILISSNIIEEDEGVSFHSELELTNNVAQVEKSYIGMSASEVSALIFEHWKFDATFVSMIKYADDSASAPDDIKEYSHVLNIIKTIAPINKPLSEVGINIGLKMAKDAGYNHEVLEDVIDDILGNI